MQNDLLEQWLAEEAAQRQRLEAGVGAGVAKPEQALQYDGLGLMQAMLRGELPYPPIADTLGFLLVRVERGVAIFQGTPAFAHYNPLGGVHGGWFATLLDSALGCAVHTALPQGKGYTTLELKVNMIRGLTVKVPRVRAEGRIIHVGGQTATAEARLVGPDGKLYAHGTTTCLVFDPRG
jgi:uncharacterized protein (TIGR00369 family)